MIRLNRTEPCLTEMIAVRNGKRISWFAYRLYKVRFPRLLTLTLAPSGFPPIRESFHAEKQNAIGAAGRYIEYVHSRILMTENLSTVGVNTARNLLLMLTHTKVSSPWITGGKVALGEQTLVIFVSTACTVEDSNANARKIIPKRVIGEF